MSAMIMIMEYGALFLWKCLCGLVSSLHNPDKIDVINIKIKIKIKMDILSPPVLFFPLHFFGLMRPQRPENSLFFPEGPNICLFFH